MKLQACIQIWWKLLKWTESACSPSVWQFAQNVLGQPQFQKALAKIAKIVWQPLQPIAGCIQPLQLTVAIWLWKVGIAVRWLSGHQILKILDELLFREITMVRIGVTCLLNPRKSPTRMNSPHTASWDVMRSHLSKVILYHSLLPRMHLKMGQLTETCRQLAQPFNQKHRVKDNYIHKRKPVA